MSFRGKKYEGKKKGKVSERKEEGERKIKKGRKKKTYWELKG
jgi:hypothetical protein